MLEVNILKSNGKRKKKIYDLFGFCFKTNITPNDLIQTLLEKADHPESFSLLATFLTTRRFDPKSAKPKQHNSPNAVISLLRYPCTQEYTIQVKHCMSVQLRPH